MAAHPAFAEWDGSVVHARAMQAELARQVSVRDGFVKPLRTIAGFDIDFEENGAITRAAAVLLDADTLQPLRSVIARIDTATSHVPGPLSFRQLPALLEALALLEVTPDLVFVDGHGIAHPRRLGIAAHFGVVTGLPSIGIAKKILVGVAPETHQVRGAYVALRHEGEQIGWLLRSKTNRNPLIVSPGHRVAMASTADLVMRFVTTYRLPEPTRLAARLASRRNEARG